MRDKKSFINILESQLTELEQNSVPLDQNKDTDEYKSLFQEVENLKEMKFIFCIFLILILHII